jgi:hypothetical protein
MEHIGEVWERNDDGAISVIIGEETRTKVLRVLLSFPGWIPYEDLLAGWTRLPWRMTLTPDPEATP